MAENVIDRRIKPFTMVSNAVIESDALTKPVEIAVYVVICKHAGNRTRQSYLRVDTIAREAHSSDRVVRRSIKALEAAGFLKVTKNYRADGGHMHNTYEILDV